MSSAVAGIEIALAIVLMVSAGLKLRRPEAARRAVGLLLPSRPRVATPQIAVASLVGGEIVLASLLAFSSQGLRVASAFMTAGLTTGFVLVRRAAIGRGFGCGCFGAASTSENLRSNIFLAGTAMTAAAGEAAGWTGRRMDPGAIATAVLVIVLFSALARPARGQLDRDVDAARRTGLSRRNLLRGGAMAAGGAAFGGFGSLLTATPAGADDRITGEHLSDAERAALEAKALSDIAFQNLRQRAAEQFGTEVSLTAAYAVRSTMDGLSQTVLKFAAGPDTELFGDALFWMPASPTTISQGLLLLRSQRSMLLALGPKIVEDAEEHLRKQYPPIIEQIYSTPHVEFGSSSTDADGPLECQICLVDRSNKCEGIAIGTVIGCAAGAVGLAVTCALSFGLLCTPATLVFTGTCGTAILGTGIYCVAQLDDCPRSCTTIKTF